MEMAMTVMTVATLQPKILRPKSPYLLPNPGRVFHFKASSVHNPQVSSIGATNLVGQFDPTIPIERAVTPPSSWYTDPSFYSLELDTLFYRGWQAVGYTEQIKNPGEFFTCRWKLLTYWETLSLLCAEMLMESFKLSTMYVDIMPHFLHMEAAASLALCALIMDGRMG